MAHLATQSAYGRLADRINRFPQGAPPSSVLFAILKMLFSEREAALVARLPIRPFRVALAARVWKLPEDRARAILDGLADRGILLDCGSEAGMTYVLPPPMAGFFEFSMMRVRADLDQKALAELFHEYINVEEEFIRSLFTTGETQIGRTFVHEGMLPSEPSLRVLDYERASWVVKSAAPMAVGTCYCRHKAEHLGRDCDAPKQICMTFNGVARSLIRHGIAREVDVVEGLDLLQEARDRRLVQFGENVRERVSFVCNCCGCCCEAMIAARRFGMLHPVHTTNFLPEVDRALCNGCGKCADACPVEAMGLVSANDPAHPKRKAARLDAATCLGCGVCASACDRRGIRLVPRAERVITPLDSTHKAVVMAIERGKLQNLLFDRHVLWSHRAMAAVLGVILKLPPVSRAMASRQMKSRYLERLFTRSRGRVPAAPAPGGAGSP
ncbi:MAG TPA: 4Fe-4S dicluster domain-containing protein [Candidatus Polarisedimenticolaceae bacterium]